MRLRPSAKVNPDQSKLFPLELDSSTEFWFAWEDVEIFAIQKAMLKQALAELRDKRKSRQMREEAWRWLFSPEQHPFSADVCAANNNYDIDVIRAQVRRFVRDLSIQM